MTSTKVLLRRLAREFRYRPLPTLAGQRATVESYDGVEAFVRSIFPADVGDPGAWATTNGEVTIARYGLIDAELLTTATALDHASTRAGIPLLRELGFLPEDGPEACAVELEMLAESLDARTCVIKVFLLTKGQPKRMGTRALMKRLSRGLPPCDFPLKLVIEDACVTNARGAWFNAHFWGP